MDDPRYQQPAHGFKRLQGIVAGGEGWRSASIGEKPTAIVSRVYGPDVFTAVNSGEINRVDIDITVGGSYGIGIGGMLQLNVRPEVARGVRIDALVVSIAGDTVSAPAIVYDLTPYQLLADKGIPGGYVPLGIDGKVPDEYLPVFDESRFVINVVGGAVIDADNGTLVWDVDKDPQEQVTTL
jgi:hypothetical protein